MKIVALCVAAAVVAHADTRVARQSDERIRRQEITNTSEIEERLRRLEVTLLNTATQSDLIDARVDMVGRAATASVPGVVQTNSYVQEVSGRITGTDDLSVAASLQARLSSVRSSEVVLRSTISTLTSQAANIPSQFSAISSTITAVAGDDQLISKLNKTYIGNPRIPVFKWQYFHTYSNRFGWFNGNSGNSFAGIAPSTWTDGSGRAWNMANDWNAINRLLIRKGTASAYGGTICAETRIFYSSTDGGVCAAAMRINNPTTRTINWTPQMLFTSYSGWGEYASISVNKAQTWSNNCQNECVIRPTLEMPANRISTVMMIATSSSPVSGWAGFYQRSTLLMFKDNGLNLPDGLEFVDDFDTLTGTWS